MGLIADSDVLIKTEPAGISVDELAMAIRSGFGPQAIEISVIAIAELTHGIYRALNDRQKAGRTHSLEDVTTDFVTHDERVSIAAMAERIEGEQAARGIAVAFEHLVMGTTALSFDFAVLTNNPKHFSLISALAV